MSELWDIFDSERRPTGRLHSRSTPLIEGDYHIVVHVWIQNSRGQYLLSQRDPSKELFPNFWESTGGAVLTGESSLEAALREVKEELGIELQAENGQLFHSWLRKDRQNFVDVWFFQQDAEIKEIQLCPGETTDARWFYPHEIEGLGAEGKLAPVFDYMGELFEATLQRVFFPETAVDHPNYVVIAARYKGEWIFVRHQDRDTYEMPGGHIEVDEAPMQAARRELYEESGAIASQLHLIGCYGVQRGRQLSFGMFYFAEVEELRPLPEEFEMAERLLSRTLPTNPTYALIYPQLWVVLQEHLQKQKY